MSTIILKFFYKFFTQFSSILYSSTISAWGFVHILLKDTVKIALAWITPEAADFRNCHICCHYLSAISEENTPLSSAFLFLYRKFNYCIYLFTSKEIDSLVISFSGLNFKASNILIPNFSHHIHHSIFIKSSLSMNLILSCIRAILIFPE